MRVIFILGCVGTSFFAAAQAPALPADTLSEVVITAFGNSRKEETAAAVGTLKATDFTLFSPQSPLPAINTIPGVRMEERSPGSYRLGIRGSALQAPFGVRNVKVYYNEIPLTDPGGTTYLNALGVSNFGRVEIIRGAGSSLYGSGTGGVVLLRGPASVPGPKAEIGFTGGSYGFFRSDARLRLGDSLRPVSVGWEHLQSTGYREQSRIRRSVFTGEGMLLKGTKSSLSFTALYSNLEYETPGALTQTEYEENPSGARPPAGSSPGAVAASAKIEQQLAVVGLTGTSQLGKNVLGKATLYASSFNQENPNIRNYSVLTAPHFGGRASVAYRWKHNQSSVNVLAGIEAQQGYGTATVFSNNGGYPDTVQSVQSTDYQSGSLFAQARYSVHNWIATVGGSANSTQLRLVAGLPGKAKSAAISVVNYTNFAPRFSLLHQLTKNASVYVAASKGFSPPPLDAVAPTGSAVNTSLRAQQGWTYEAGYKQQALAQKLSGEVTAFYGGLNDLVVVRKDAAGGDTYVNAGTTEQRGIETALEYNWGNALAFGGTCRVAYTGSFFEYKEFLTASGDFSGKQYPGVAPYTLSVVATLIKAARTTLSTSYFYSHDYWANDANTAAIAAYHLLSCKADQVVYYKNNKFTLTVGVDNLLHQRYTLGPDLNAFGGRFYNAAPGRNFYLGLRWGWLK